MTIIELMVSLSVAAILLGIAVPAFQELTRNNRLTALTNELVSALNLARSEAIKRGLTVTVCKTADPSIASPVCTTGASGWQAGWLVFVDGGTQGTVDASDTRLRVGQPAAGSATIGGGSNFGNWVSYLPSGVSQGDGGLANGTLALCLDTQLRSLLINTTGRIRVTKGTC